MAQAFLISIDFVRCIFLKMHFHTTSIDDLYEYIPRQILPEEYGGEAGKLDDLKDHFMNSMLQKRFLFQFVLKTIFRNFII